MLPVYRLAGTRRALELVRGIGISHPPFTFPSTPNEARLLLAPKLRTSQLYSRDT
jgi:hypothetical protein